MKTNELTAKELIEKQYTVFIAGLASNAKDLNLKPFGIETTFIDVMNKENHVFLNLLNQLDGIAYGNKNLAMPKWVGLDCGLLPSAFIGLAKPAEKSDTKILEQFDLSADYTGLVPISEFCALPKLGNLEMVAHTLACIEPGKGLGLATKVLGLKIYNAQEIFGIAQYNNSAVKLHTKISDLELVSTTAPLHELSEQTFVYKCAIPKNLDDILLKKHSATKLPKEYAGYDFLLDPEDANMKTMMQDVISSEIFKFYVVQPGQIYTNDKLYIPIKKEYLQRYEHE